MLHNFNVFCVCKPASQVSSGVFECLLQRQVLLQMYCLHLFLSPPAVSHSFLGLGFAAAQCVGLAVHLSSFRVEDISFI